MTRRSVIAKVIAGAVGLTLAAPAHAACNGTWDLTGDWWLNQGNGYAFNLRIKTQNGNNIYGDAKTGYGERQFFSGTFDGQYIEMTIPATGGVYSGGIDDRGRIGGTTHNADNTESTEWWGDRAATASPPQHLPHHQPPLSLNRARPMCSFQNPAPDPVRSNHHRPLKVFRSRREGPANLCNR